ncbi:hypothetical protein DLJ53_03185 [Acuticoccus sediminis]|uniref:Uncharacterized protein n=1 Tax=Acuticoccus sediminis TaxID=2184697 RepID=A0A8B2P0M2_9HYPH|nr:hypothetical protein [Acuticoccus sediminis]RAI03514.1 hypothetical protein DLJ53_03185 [Acuticoccus sediminis]
MSDGAIEFGDLACEEVDHRLDLGGDLVLAGVVPARRLGLADIDQLPAVPEEIGQPAARRAAWASDGEVEDRAHLGEHAGINPVGLGEDAGGPDELAPGVDWSTRR